jgi:murein DD-endopeptidase MepM/ murein hydrolase activator NlpD
MRKRVLVATLAFAASAVVANAETLFPSPIVVQQDATLAGAFGPRVDGDQFHPGADIAAPAGAAVHAPAAGRVLRVYAPGEREGYHGQVVEIDHGENGRTRFSNLQGVTLRAGDELQAGDVIGRIDANERPHVHIELWRDGRLHDPAAAMTLIGGR